MRVEELGFDVRKVREGLAEIFVPAEEVRAPRKATVFYNPAMALNRDLAMAVLRAFSGGMGRGVRACEPLCGCGVRGIRMALEVPSVDEVVMGDLNPNAVLLSQLNVRMNGVQDKVSVRRSDANVLLTSYSAPGQRFDYIDVDPFGSPAPFMDSAIRAIRSGGLVALTATDMAPLCGVHVNSCLRKYGAMPMRTYYSKELAVRILLGAFARVASAHDMGVRPVLCHATDHYARVYCIAERGQGKANESVGNLGYIAHCPSCHEREVTKGLADLPEARCPSCGSRRMVSGPLWTGRIFDIGFCSSVARAMEEMPWLGRRTRRIMAFILAEAEGPPTYFAIQRLCDAFGLRTPPMDELVEALREEGWWASRTHFDPQGIRTDAPAEAVLRAVRELAG